MPLTVTGLWGKPGGVDSRPWRFFWEAEERTSMCLWGQCRHSHERGLTFQTEFQTSLERTKMPFRPYLSLWAKPFPFILKNIPNLTNLSTWYTVQQLKQFFSVILKEISLIVKKYCRWEKGFERKWYALNIILKFLNIIEEKRNKERKS